MIQVLVAGGTVSASGDNTIVTPASGNRLAVYYFNYNPETANTCFFKFGASGTQQMKCNVPANSVIARGFGFDSLLFGGVGVPLILNLSSAGNVNFTVYYTEGFQ